MAFKTIFGVFLAVLLICSLALGCFSIAQAESTIPKPSVPQFTASIIDKSFDVPPTKSVDPYNGQTITTKGYYVRNLVLEIRIKNENFTPFNHNSGPYQVNYYYNIRWKGHFEENWANMFAANYGSGYFPRAAGAETVFSTDREYSSGFNIPDLNDFSPNDQIDLQVEAMIGYVVDPGPFESEVFVGEVSGWSNTQTVILSNDAHALATTDPTATTLSSQNSTATPVGIQNDYGSTEHQWDWATLAIGIVVGFVVLLVIVLARKKQQNQGS